ncbi:GDSL-type esterase/lipase family protein [Porticoccaceae bacterium]|nr:GDSL-type esterase/lipase family protein [Porticoccaceae bacterium]MDA8941242.1 GDSL-type esterase/lipase family protein [Porticoccaceae bacterium]MDA9583435.1 GDSL-type esterase/lipase family protein [Porticoccaceae bacterium]MDB2401090.1 GDSL-type esterase/lipase family protein [Porticoccaceae bacterium]MDB2559415.1 GDSL-type esterase/lipase family protein [Porticoccaceae bacterium]
MKKIVFWVCVLALSACGGGGGELPDAVPVAPPTYTVSITSEDGGSVDISGGEYQNGTILEVVATPDDGFMFTQWSDGNRENPRALTVNTDVSLSAGFLTAIDLNLRFHVMQGDPWIHGSGNAMPPWVSEDNIIETVLPELNDIWQQAGIQWTLETIFLESIKTYDGYQNDIQYIVDSQRDGEGTSDPERLPRLYNLMQPDNRSSDEELDGNLFHIYIFPFIGNTSQGNAMSSFGWHSVVGSWSNKHNDGGIPEKNLLIEAQQNFVRGSLARTIAHELGHVLSLRHDCEECLMHAQGYDINDIQTQAARDEAVRRSYQDPMSIDILSLGDSYTIGESVCDTCSFPEQLKSSLAAEYSEQKDVTLEVIAKTGWTTTNLKNAIASEDPSNDFDVVTLLIGVNNQFQGKLFSVYEKEFIELVTSAISFVGGDKSKLIIVSIPDYGYTPFGQNRNPQNISAELDMYNSFAENYASENNLSYVYITDITREGLEDPSLVASDGLHPSEIAYSRFVERLLPLALEKIKKL